MNAIILAAGKGTRMKSLTENTPKPMILFQKKPILEHLLTELKKAGVKETIIVVGYKKEKIINYFKNCFGGIKIKYVIQKNQKGTGHALLLCKKQSQKKFMVLNGDVIVKAGFIRKIIQEHENEALVVGRTEKKPWNFGVIEKKGKLLQKINEKPPRKKCKSNLVNTGVYCFTKTIFDALEKVKESQRKEIEITCAVNILAEKNGVRVIKTGSKIIDIGTPQDLKKNRGNVS
jgi:UDP-N-acetylglucosamine diphosphorylase / glucose-1-phosphate thymidylyltransferase / UDP-N-acetylgalactosamine diphosphorylase / glucosamine-1-phosphate N-acetyltransferase / galactosamine-1-phosphate N-acetyltransferase